MGSVTDLNTRQIERFNFVGELLKSNIHENKYIGDLKDTLGNFYAVHFSIDENFKTMGEASLKTYLNSEEEPSFTDSFSMSKRFSNEMKDSKAPVNEMMIQNENTMNRDNVESNSINIRGRSFGGSAINLYLMNDNRDLIFYEDFLRINDTLPEINSLENAESYHELWYARIVEPVEVNSLRFDLNDPKTLKEQLDTIENKDIINIANEKIMSKNFMGSAYTSDNQIDYYSVFYRVFGDSILESAFVETSIQYPVYMNVPRGGLISGKHEVKLELRADTMVVENGTVFKEDYRNGFRVGIKGDVEFAINTSDHKARITESKMNGNVNNLNDEKLLGLLDVGRTFSGTLNSGIAIYDFLRNELKDDTKFGDYSVGYEYASSLHYLRMPSQAYIYNSGEHFSTKYKLRYKTPVNGRNFLLRATCRYHISHNYFNIPWDVNPDFSQELGYKFAEFATRIDLRQFNTP